MHDQEDRNMVRDYYEFIIINITRGRTFDILDVVADTLPKLKGDLPYSQVFCQAIQKYVGNEEQDYYLEAFSHMDFDQATLLAPHHYLGNRVRCWDVADSLHGILRAALQDSLQVITLPESRLSYKVSTDLESYEIITQVPDYQLPSTCPIIMQGIGRP